MRIKAGLQPEGWGRLTFQLFIYENLNAGYHYQIMRTRDVKKRKCHYFNRYAKQRAVPFYFAFISITN